MKRFLTSFILAIAFLISVSSATAVELDEGYELTKGVPGYCPDVINITDAWRFASCNCTSYVAYRLNKNGVKDFTNQYGGVPRWSDAYYWDDVERAGKAGIRVDGYPAVGSVAQWNIGEIGGDYGHVAYVYKLNVHGDGALSSIEVAEYNYRARGEYGIRTLTPGEPEYPPRFIHFEDKVDGEKPNATCVTNAVNLPSGYGPFCWIHGQYSAVCEHAAAWYYFDQQYWRVYTLNSSSCPPQATGGAGGGYVTYVGDDKSRYAVGSNLEPSGQPPITGSNNSGKLPNLTMRDVYLLDANKNRVSSIHVKQKGYCHMNIKNTGERMAKEKFENRCWISDGKWFDGKDNAIDIGKEDMENLDDGRSRSSDEDFFAPEWPGTYNLVGCTDASKKEKESNEKDNCNTGDHAVIKEYVFEVVSDPNLTTTSISLTGGKTTFAINEPFSISSTTFNQGENVTSQ